MSTVIPNKALAAAAAVRDALNDLRQRVSALKAEEVVLRERKKALLEMPIPLEDVKRVLLDYVDARAQIFLADGSWKQSLQAFIYPVHPGIFDEETKLPAVKPLSYTAAELVRTGDVERKVFGAEHPKLFSPNVDVLRITDAPYYFFLGDLIKAKIECVFHGNWTPIPMQLGPAFQIKLGHESTSIWAKIPRQP
jgi:hypothetical protein